ncbi:MAG: dihydrofolate reductase [Patescibacteria group bacterium]
MPPQVKMILASTATGLIGRSGKLPWQGRLKSDMERFKEITTGKAVVMGRKTYYSIPPKSRPLSDRFNIMVSRNLSLIDEGGVWISHDVASALKLANEYDKLFVAGGAEIYNLFLPVVQEILWTEVEVPDSFLVNVNQDGTYFPIQEILADGWTKVDQQICSANRPGDDFPSIYQIWKRTT